MVGLLVGVVNCQAQRRLPATGGRESSNCRGRASSAVGKSVRVLLCEERTREEGSSGLYPKPLREKSAGWIRVCRWLVIGFRDGSPRLRVHVPARRSQQTERATINRAHAMSFAARARAIGGLCPLQRACARPVGRCIDCIESWGCWGRPRVRQC